MSLPVPKVEIAFSTQPNDPSPAWVDVTSYTRNVTDSITITRGRTDRYSTVQPATLSLTLINSDGRFTPGNMASPYYPNVKKGRKIRVSVTNSAGTFLRFVGFVNEWPVTWADASASVSDVQISASSRMANLGRGKLLPSVSEIECLSDIPEAYFPLGDSAGSLNAGNVATTVQPQMALTPFGGGSNSNITFGSATGPATDSLTAAQFTRVSATAGAYLASSPLQSFNSGSDPSILLEAWMSSSQTQEMGIAQLDAGNSLYLALGTNASGKLIATYATPATGVVYTITSSATITDGALHHVAVRQTTSGGTTSSTLFLDGASAGTSSNSSSQFNLTRLVAGGGLVNSAFSGTLAHVVAYSGAAISDSRVNQHYLAGSTGFSGEASGARVRRLALYAGIPDAEIGVETGLSTSITNQDTTGRIPLELMQEVVATEGGVLYDGRDGLLYFHARSHRYNSPVSITLQGSDLMASLSPRLDDQGMVNDVTAARDGGVSVRSVDTSSVDEYGTYREDLTLLTTSDNEVFDAASWKVYTASIPQVTVPTAEVELARFTAAFQGSVLARDIGDRATLAALPSQAPASSMDFFIEGWTETIADGSHRFVFNLSNANQSGVWQLDSSIYSLLGTSTRLAY